VEDPAAEGTAPVAEPPVLVDEPPGLLTSCCGAERGAAAPKGFADPLG